MFKLVSDMNEAFGNPKGNPLHIDPNKIRRQAKNIFDEACELMVALGADPYKIGRMNLDIESVLASASTWKYPIVMDDVRDALCDINVFSLGTHHLLGIDADRDMKSVIDGVMSRFIKDVTDKQATIEKHAMKGVIFVKFEGDYPTMIMKSTADQPDAPTGKFLKSASYKEPVFYPVNVVFVVEPYDF